VNVCMCCLLFRLAWGVLYGFFPICSLLNRMMRSSPAFFEKNHAPNHVWLSLLLVYYEMRSYLVACMDESFECTTHGPLYHGCIALSYIAKEVRIEKTEPCGTKGW
jgi:hypothetical protein